MRRHSAFTSFGSRRAGSALLYVVFAIALVAILLTAMTLSFESRLHSRAYEVKKQQAMFLADGALTGGLATIRSLKTPLPEGTLLLDEVPEPGQRMTVQVKQWQGAEVLLEAVGSTETGGKRALEAYGLALNTHWQLQGFPRLAELRLRKGIVEPRWDTQYAGQAWLLLAQSDGAMAFNKAFKVWGLHALTTEGQAVDVQMNAPLTAERDVFIEGDLTLDAHIQAKQVAISGALNCTENGGIYAEKIILKEAPAEEALAQLHGDVIVDETLEPQMCYYLLSVT